MEIGIPVNSNTNNEFYCASRIFKLGYTNKNSILIMYSYPTVFTAHRIQAQGLSDIIQYLMNAWYLMVYLFSCLDLWSEIWQKKKLIIVKAEINVKASEN